MKSPSFSRTQPCAECPWRKDVPPGRFSPERYVALRTSVQQGFHPMFACHKSSEDQSVACAGYLLSPDSENNFNVRIALAYRTLDPTKLHSDVPLFETFNEMAEVNGVEE